MKFFSLSSAAHALKAWPGSLEVRTLPFSVYLLHWLFPVSQMSRLETQSAISKVDNSPSQGYSESIFVTSPDLSFKCPECCLILRDPHLLSCCGSHVCEVNSVLYVLFCIFRSSKLRIYLLFLLCAICF